MLKNSNKIPFKTFPNSSYLFRMKNTPLTQKHIALGAKMANFAGFNMPIQYTSIIEEHHCVRNSVGMFDVSHMGEFIVKGEHALAFLQNIVSNDVAKLEKNQAQYAYLPNATGGIVDDLLIYHLDDDNYMCVVNAGNIEKDWNWFQQHNTQGVELHNISDKTALLAIQGPNAADALQQLTTINLKAIPYYRFVRGNFAGIDNVIISATGYTGAGGFELYFNAADAVAIWDKIMEAGKAFGIQAIGLGARDTLRLEKGYCLYGNDIDDTTSPIAAGLSWVTKFNKNFVGKELLETQKQNGVAQKLIGFKMIDKGIARHDYLVVDANGNTIGKVTSGSQSPSLNYGIGLAYVDTQLAKTGNTIYIAVRNKNLQAEIVKLPFL